ncbi:MAG: IS200/IS605 family transposase [Cytophagales bacterium]|nr:IS200/IS605 family transposase [Cytophagales bacterium]
MANTYTQISIQLVFAVKYRQALITPDFKVTLHKYISGILRNQDQKLLAINGMPDHIHIFFGMRADSNLSDLVRDIKSDSSTFVNEKKLSKHKFRWQDGFGAFSYSKSQRDSVIKYILNQEQHHAKKTFREEYFEFLKEFDVEYDERYVFEFFD